MRIVSTAISLAMMLVPSSALSWGYEAHEIIAAIARSELTPAVRGKVDAILATDPDTLTKPDMVSRATWADAWRSAGHRETAQWHFVDTELDGSADVGAACFGHPTAADPASAGPVADCVVDKINEFVVELGAPTKAPGERLLALKYLLHFVGDVHQPLHASDNHDRGGNCVLVSLGGSRTVNLHAYWDTAVVEGAVGKDVNAAASILNRQITPTLRSEWRRGSPTAWATEAFQVARSAAYTIGSAAGCQSNAAPIAISSDYEATAYAAARIQLERAGVRLAMVLNTALATVPIPVAMTSDRSTGSNQPNVAPLDRMPQVSAAVGRSPTSLACSADADARGLHGKERQRFRRRCIRDRDGG